MNLVFSITELSSLTNKSRPSLYKYINAYEVGQYDLIPFSFIQLFELMDKPNVKRSEIISYCNMTFLNVDCDIKVNEIVTLIKNNKNKLNLDKIKTLIEEEISNG